MFSWQPLGKLFEPQALNLLGNQAEYAQSPQLIDLGDRLRVYFCSRIRDKPGHYISHPQWVDFTPNLKSIISISSSPLLPPASLGAFDEHGIFPFSPILHEGQVYAYTCGWSRRVSVPVETATGLAISRDGGNTFERYGSGPVLSPSLNEPYLVGDSFVLHTHGQFHMWYMFGTAWHRSASSNTPERTYKIGHAVSDDGINWKKDEARQIIPDVIGPLESQALPSVIELNGRFHMVFCYRQSFDFRHNHARSYRIGYAFSDDLESWTRDDKSLNLHSQGDWDSEMMCYPNICRGGQSVYLLYNGNHFGRNGFGAFKLMSP